MNDLLESIQTHGVLMPILARPYEGVYQIVSGHRRHRACQLAEKPTIPVIVREMDDDTATMLMVDANLQREVILPSEKAFAYQMKLDAMRRQNRLSQVGTNTRVEEVLAEETGDSRNQIHRYIRLTKLHPELLRLLDEKLLSFTAGVEVSYLPPETQMILLDLIQREECTPTMSQAVRLRKFYQEGKMSETVMEVIMTEGSSVERKLVLKQELLDKYFPRDTAPKDVYRQIEKLLKDWQRRLSRRQER